MAEFNQSITRPDAEALIPEDVAEEIIKNVPENSAVMSMARKLRNMSRGELRLPILSSLVQAGFVEGGSGLISTTKAEWTDKYIYAEKIASIVPIPNDVLADVAFNIWDEVQPELESAMGQAFDAAVLYGVGAPASFPLDILAAAEAAGNNVVLAAIGDLYDDILSTGGIVSKIEDDGFMADGYIGALSIRSALRGLRDDSGQPIFSSMMQDKNVYQLDGVPIQFPRNGAVDQTKSLLIVGDWMQLVYSMRTDIEYKVLDQAVITDQSGEVVLNLAQQDMSALRVIMRVGWQLPNPVNRIEEDEAVRYPFSVLKPA